MRTICSSVIEKCWLTVFVFAACYLGFSTLAFPAEPSAREGATSREVMQDAQRRIPFNEMTGEARNKLDQVVTNASFFRRLPTEAIDCDPELFVFLVRYPEVLVNIWEQMGITKVELQRVAPYQFKGTDGAGTTCNSELIYGTPDLHIYYSTGAYSGSMLPKEVTGKCVCVLRSSKAKSATGRWTVTSQMDIFLKFDSVGADLIARTIAPIVGKTADYNFHETAKFISQVSQVCEHNPAAIEQLADRLEHCDPKIRQQLAEIARRIATDSASQRVLAAKDGQSPVPMRLVPNGRTKHTNVGPTGQSLQSELGIETDANPVSMIPNNIEYPARSMSASPPPAGATRPLPTSRATPASAGLTPGPIKPAKPDLIMKR